MTQPIQLPDSGSDDASPARGPGPRGGAVLAALAALAGTALLGAAGGLVWGAVAPRATLVMAGPGAADLLHVETSAYIAADAAFAVIALVGGAASGALGYLFAVRRHGPPAMVAVLLGAVGAAYLARWVGEQSGLATFEHLLATLPVGARLRDSLTLGASSALAFWPLAAGAVAGGLAALRQREAGRAGAHRAG